MPPGESAFSLGLPKGGSLHFLPIQTQADTSAPGLPGPRELPGEEPAAHPVHQGLPTVRRGPLQQIQELLGGVQTGQAGRGAGAGLATGAQAGAGRDWVCSGWQGVISAAQYYKSCRDLLGENFEKIFNELLVLLPDTAKQQELLLAHTDFRGREKPPGTKAKKNRKSAWQASTQQVGLDCCVCPTCQQVLAHGDVGSHQALHAARDDDFPSLQALARILT